MEDLRDFVRVVAHKASSAGVKLGVIIMVAESVNAVASLTNLPSIPIDPTASMSLGIGGLAVFVASQKVYEESKVSFRSSVMTSQEFIKTTQKRFNSHI